MELFAGRGPAPAACDDGEGGFPEPPPTTQYGDSSSSMLVIRDALLSQLHMDRLRQEIIVAELAKIERAMAFVFHEQMPHSSRGAAVGPYHDVAGNVGNDLTKKGGVRGGVELESQKPAPTEDLVPECKPKASNEAILPTSAASLQIWSCAICRVGAPTEGHLQQHFAGQKHRSTVANLVSRNKANGQKATATAEESGNNVRPYEQKARSDWICRFCQSNCNCKSDLENHLRGKRHKARIQALLEECKKIAAGNCASQEADSQPNTEANSSTWICSLCQAKGNRQSDLANHLRGKRHLLNFLVLQVEAKQYLSEWGCGICQAKCNSVSQFENHCSSMGHRQKVEALQRGGQNAGLGGFKTVASSDEGVEMHRVLYFCKLCNLHCNSKNTLSEHCRGKKHTEKVEKRLSLSFCEVCDVQCNSEKMLAHHRTGKTHLAKLHGC